MRFLYIEIPGNGQVAVDVEQAAVLDDPEVVQVDPVLAAMYVDIADQILKELEVGFVHDAGGETHADLLLIRRRLRVAGRH
jgi:hypothetical protein